MTEHIGKNPSSVNQEDLARISEAFGFDVNLPPATNMEDTTTFMPEQTIMDVIEEPGLDSADSMPEPEPRAEEIPANTTQLEESTDTTTLSHKGSGVLIPIIPAGHEDDKLLDRSAAIEYDMTQEYERWAQSQQVLAEVTDAHLAQLAEAEAQRRLAIVEKQEDIKTIGAEFATSTGLFHNATTQEFLTNAAAQEARDTHGVLDQRAKAPIEEVMVQGDRLQRTFANQLRAICSEEITYSRAAGINERLDDTVREYLSGVYELIGAVTSIREGTQNPETQTAEPSIEDKFTDVAVAADVRDQAIKTHESAQNDLERARLRKANAEDAVRTMREALKADRLDTNRVKAKRQRGAEIMERGTIGQRVVDRLLRIAGVTGPKRLGNEETTNYSALQSNTIQQELN